MLSADERWRLTKEASSIALFDLVADPAGHLNVIADHSVRVDEMVTMYAAWVRETRRIPLRAIVQGDADWDGELVHLTGGRDRVDLVGHDMLRTPGFKSWSFANI